MTVVSVCVFNSSYRQSIWFFSHSNAAKLFKFILEATIYHKTSCPVNWNQGLVRTRWNISDGIHAFVFIVCLRPCLVNAATTSLRSSNSGTESERNEKKNETRSATIGATQQHSFLKIDFSCTGSPVFEKS